MQITPCWSLYKEPVSPHPYEPHTQGTCLAQQSLYEYTTNKHHQTNSVEENSRGNCEKLKFTVISSPLQSILTRFLSTSREWSWSKDSGIWLTGFVLSLSYFAECQMTTEATQNSKKSGCFRIGIIVHRQQSLSSVTH